MYALITADARRDGGFTAALTMGNEASCCSTTGDAVPPLVNPEAVEEAAAETRQQHEQQQRALWVNEEKRAESKKPTAEPELQLLPEPQPQPKLEPQPQVSTARKQGVAAAILAPSSSSEDVEQLTPSLPPWRASDSDDEFSQPVPRRGQFIASELPHMASGQRTSRQPSSFTPAEEPEPEPDAAGEPGDPLFEAAMRKVAKEAQRSSKKSGLLPCCGNRPPAAAGTAGRQKHNDR